MSEARSLETNGLAVSASEIAALLGISPVHVHRDRRDGRCGGIPFCRIGSRVVYPVRQVQEWLAARTQRPAAVPPPSSSATRRGRPTKTEQVAAASRGLTVAQLRAEERGAA
jgi:hypothetical protein